MIPEDAILCDGFIEVGWDLAELTPQEALAVWVNAIHGKINGSIIKHNHHGYTVWHVGLAENTSFRRQPTVMRFYVRNGSTEDLFGDIDKELITGVERPGWSTSYSTTTPLRLGDNGWLEPIRQLQEELTLMPDSDTVTP